MKMLNLTAPLGVTNNGKNTTTMKNGFIPLDVTDLYIWLGSFGFLCCIGGLGNTTLLVVTISERNLRTKSGFLVVHALFIYTLLCGILFPLAVIMLYGNQRLKWGEQPDLWCNNLYFIQLTEMYAAHWADACVALNCFLAVYFPTAYRRITSTSYLAGNFCLP